MEVVEQTNLKSFVEQFIQKRPKQEFPHLFIVDKQTGPYRSIQQAIDAALPNSLIKITEGFYEQNLVITYLLHDSPKKQNEQQSKVGVILLAGQGTAIHVKLSESDQECIINGMRFSHSGNSANNLKKELLEHQHILNIFQHHDNIQQLQNEFVNRMAPNKMESIILLAERGKVTADNCIFSLNYLVKSCASTIPAIWVEKQASLHLVNSQVKGHEKKSTIGVVSRLGTIHIQNSIISNHKQGGLLLWGIRDHYSRIIKNYIEDNSVGIHMVGEQFPLKVYNNSISRNKIGIKIGLACEPDISRNIITQNTDGIEVNSAFPNISLNKIEKNKGSGIVCKSYKRFICKALIRKNVAIVSNKLNGILIEGENNKSEVINNHLIGYNEQAGIKVEKEAFPVISGNKIYKNYREGVLVVENSNAVVEKNEISHNIECNVAMGGKHSHHSAIIDNVISDSPSTGIYLIRSGKLRVLRNDLTKNRDAMILSASQPQIQRNHIYENKNNGIICENNAQPTIVQNFITRNCGVGLLLRQNSCKRKAVLHSNVLVSNEIDCGIQQFDKELVDRLKESNTIEKQIYYPEGLPCTIM